MSTDLPANAATGQPLIPDQGWDTDPRRAPDEYDWSAFPASWQDALETQRTAQAAKDAARAGGAA